MKHITLLISYLFFFLCAYAKAPQECKLSLTPKQCQVLYPENYRFAATQEFSVLSFNKKVKTGIAYNNKSIVFFKASEAQTKLIKDCGIKDFQQKDIIEFENKVYAIKNNIYSSAYSLFRTDSISKREAFVMDSLEKRTQFVNDSIINYQSFVKDSLRHKEEYDTMLLQLDSLRAAFKNRQNDRDKVDKNFWASKGTPIALNVVSWNSNSVGGITAKFEVLNLSKKTIKYVAITGYFNNAVGDRVYNQIGSGTTFTVKGVGPIAPAPTNLIEFKDVFDAFAIYDFDDCFFYSKTANTIEISSVKLTYTDGSTQVVSGKVLNKQLYWKEDDLIDSVYGYKEYLDYLKNVKEIESTLYSDFTYKPDVYEPLVYDSPVYTPIVFNYNNYRK